MAERRSRPDVKEIKDAYDYLFNSDVTLATLKNVALGGRLFVSRDPNSAGVVGRSIAWKLFLIEPEPLQPAVPNAIAKIPLQSVRASRRDFQQLLLDKMRAPDGSYEDGFIIPGTGTSPPRSERANGNLDRNNPLSLHDENPWTAWFAAMELRKTILQDVERTFPDIGYFREQEVQAQLTNILFLYSVTHPDIGYRQGMHELLACLYYAVDFDSVPDESGLDSELEEFCSRAWVAADAWTLFSLVMHSAGRWYEWQETKSSSRGHTPIPSHVQLSATPDVVLKPYVAPIIEACNRVQATLLKSVDPQLWRAMQSAGIEPQIYGIRWLRLLFTREFNMDEAMMLWDGLFACDPSFELAPWICVAMLIRIRNKLIPSDYSTQLTYLLRYPSTPTPPGNPNLRPSMHPAVLLLRQALTLQMSPTSATGMTIITENNNLLDIPTEVPERTPPPARRRARTALRADSFSNDAGPSGKPMHARQGSTPMGLPEMIARGLLERGESLGINRTVMSAVSELKRNLPDLASSLARLPNAPSSSATTYAAYPLVDERPLAPTEKPPWEPRTRFEMERDVTELRALQKRLGDSVTWIVDTLLLDEESDDPERIAAVRERKRDALDCLSYVRDVLKGTIPSGEIEEARLVGEEEMKKRKRAAEERAIAEAVGKLGDPVAASSSRFMLTPPQPTATTLPQFQAHPQASMRRLPDNTSPAPAFPRAALGPQAPAPQHVPRQRAPSPTPTVSVLPPNANSMALAPWNHSRSAFSSRESPIATLPRLPSRPSAAAAVRHGGSRMSSPSAFGAPQSPRDDGSTRAQPPPGDPLGVLR